MTIMPAEPFPNSSIPAPRRYRALLQGAKALFGSSGDSRTAVPCTQRPLNVSNRLKDGGICFGSCLTLAISRILIRTHRTIALP